MTTNPDPATTDPHTAWDLGYRHGRSNTMRQLTDEPNAPASVNPFPAPVAGCSCEEVPCVHTPRLQPDDHTVETPVRDLAPGEVIAWLGPHYDVHPLTVVTIEPTGRLAPGTVVPMVRVYVNGMPRPYRNELEVAADATVERVEEDR